ncbi:MULTISPECIES: hypothetical protein [unclassified Actinomyces]|uniref:hypothetical protein n=1 Tax=unclassified Actinomyces TaxID=2609248 RepID=UPI002017D36D|nr:MULTISPECIES: hypothetical protein [unclassified Actinomyces]MCL3777584.1 hypothetical protein [Actinomyces sp. AC-20-1]MCL3789547.1 hypothetical protein [Actinomyces sp. 187325]MCL3791075.1 hypothetical protein [Actinomyces sp. 186855]MCL3793399.1 hypothetical protein [Actinomyces sp. 217892]
MPLLDLPVSVLLALWAPVPSSVGTALVQGPDGAHDVVPVPTGSPGSVGLAASTASGWDGAGGGTTAVGLPAWLEAARPLHRCAAVLPSPADPVPGLALALEEGEAVLLEGGAGSSLEGRSVLLVPRASGTSVTWAAHVLGSSPAPFDASQARRDVHRATEEAIEALVALDLARERPDLAEVLTDLVTAVLDPGLLPPWLDARRRDLLERSLRLSGICELALADDGAAATASQGLARSRVLRRLGAVARHGVAAATETWGPRQG